MTNAQATYRRILPSFWTDPEVRRLRLDTDQLVVLLHCFTSPHSNMAGLFWCPLAYVAAETGVDVADVQEAIEGPLARFVSYDHETEEMLVHKMAYHNIGPGGLRPKDNRVKGLQRCLADAHSPELLAKWAEIYPDWPVQIPEPPEPAETKEDEGAYQAPYQGDPHPPWEAIAVTEADTEADTENNHASRRAREASGWERLERWLGEHAHAMDVMAAVPDQREGWAAALFGLYVTGLEAHTPTDEAVWAHELPDGRRRWVDQAERPRLLAKAMQRTAGESKPYQGKFFRRVLADVVAEEVGGDDGPGSPNPDTPATARSQPARRVHVER